MKLATTTGKTVDSRFLRRTARRAIKLCIRVSKRLGFESGEGEKLAKIASLHRRQFGGCRLV